MGLGARPFPGTCPFLCVDLLTVHSTHLATRILAPGAQCIAVSHLTGAAGWLLIPKWRLRSKVSVNSFYLEKVHSFTAKWPQTGVIHCQPSKKLMSRFIAFFSANLRATEAGNFESKGSHEVGEVSGQIYHGQFTSMLFR